MPNTGIGSVLSQVLDGKETVIGYYSRLLSDAERKYCITRREFLGVVWSVEHFKPYLYGHQFLLRTDNSAVSHMLTLSDANEQIQRWQLFLSQFKFSTIHRPGRHHVNADFMSRLQCDQCDRQEVPEPNRPTGHIRKFHLKKSTDVPSCTHTKQTDDSLEEACNVIKRPHKKIPVPLTQQLFGEALERVSIDLIGPLKETSRGYRYAVTIEDNFTKALSSVHGSTGETPHFMLTGREMKVPINLLYTKPSKDMTSVSTYVVSTYVRQLEDRLNKAYALVWNNLKSVQRIQKKRYETNSHE
ncbi:uncharacterized protein LOC135503425 [Lineus longissimus]|uniref:uncharacterized protein LOC135503425 n=1 Tax=Lineus longissimus TaxID=88925 RepID=UPI00315C4F84